MALLVDNASSHSNLYEIREQVVVIPLPRNVTSVHQPMDMVVISTWKQTYRRFLVQELVRDIESRAERRAFYQGRTYGMNGMAQGYDPHMLDAANLPYFGGRLYSISGGILYVDFARHDVLDIIP